MALAGANVDPRLARYAHAERELADVERPRVQRSPGAMRSLVDSIEGCSTGDDGKSVKGELSRWAGRLAGPGKANEHENPEWLSGASTLSF